MARLLFLCIILLILPMSFSLEEWSSDADSLNLNVQITGDIETSDPANTKYIQILLDYNPLDDYRQTILNQMHFPEDSYKGLSEEKLLYEFNKLSNKKVEYGVSSNVRVYNKLVEVREKEKFPIDDLPKDVIKYTALSPTIDTNNEDIIRKSNELAYGEDDLYKLVTKMSGWVADYVTYDLDVRKYGDSLDASWVLSHQIGVCKEKTNLLIALLRVQGIPARFVSGIAYSSLNLTGSPWSAHAWAEVYFPSDGWIPFDPTYQQYGFIDPTHISLKKSLDGTGETISYKWNENGSKVHITPVFISTKVDSEEGKIVKRASVISKTEFSETGIGSYNLVEAEIINNLDSYISPIVILSNVNGMTILSQNPRLVILEPKEHKKIYFIVKTASTLQEDFKYEIPIVVSSTMSDESASSFTVFSGGENVSEATVSELIPPETNKTVKITESYDVVCQPKTKNGVLENSTFNLICKITNRGKKWQNSSVCTDNICRDVILGPGKYKTVTFTLNISSEPKIYNVYIITKENTYTFRIPVTPLGTPSIKVINIDFPEKVKFADKFTLSFSLAKGSGVTPTDVLAKISSPYDAQQVKIDSLEQQRDISLKMSAGNLNEGNNTITISTIFHDSANNTFHQEKNITIELGDLTKSQDVRLFFRHILLWIFSFLR